jgi:hypothetical protein
MTTKRIMSKPCNVIFMEPQRKSIRRVCPWCDKSVKGRRIHRCLAISQPLSDWPWWVRGVNPHNIGLKKEGACLGV